jgi:hypothetical protein
MKTTHHGATGRAALSQQERESDAIMPSKPEGLLKLHRQFFTDILQVGTTARYKILKQHKGVIVKVGSNSMIEASEVRRILSELPRGVDSERVAASQTARRGKRAGGALFDP